MAVMGLLLFLLAKRATRKNLELRAMARHNGYLSITRLRAQFIKEVLSILRDPRSRMIVFVPPLLQLLVFAFAATLEVRNIDIAVHNQRSEEHTSELQSLMRISYAVFCLKKKKNTKNYTHT